jgi:hypothetical protein
MVRVEKAGYLTVELANAISESGQGLTVKTMPAVKYGGTALDKDGKPAPLAQISIKIKPELLQELPMRFQTNIVTSDKGEWSSAPLPADASQLMIALNQRDASGTAVVSQLDAAALQLAKPKAIVAVSPALDAPQAAFGVLSNGAQLVKVPAPEQAIVLELMRPWTDGSKWERNTAPVVYGIDLARPEPRITLADVNAKTMWAMKFVIPIDAKQYPIVKFKYRAQNTGSKTEYILRLSHGAADARQIAKLFNKDDLKADGQVHELTANLRDQKMDDGIVECAVALWSDDKPAWLDVVGLSFSAAPDAQASQKLGDDPEIKFNVTTLDGKPLAGAKVTVDAERTNFARNAETDASGSVSIKPLANESHLHMARVEKAGHMTVDRAIEGNTADLKTVPAVRYGGVAINESGQMAANSQIVVRSKNQLLRDLGQASAPVATVVTDDKGRWTTPPLPADAEQLTIQSKTPVNGGEPIVATIEPDKSQTPSEPWPPKGAASPVNVASSDLPTKLKPPATKPAPAAPKMAPITAIVQRVDDSTTSVGWTGIEGDNLLVVAHPQPGKDEPGKIALAEITELTLRKAGTYSPPTTSPSTKPVEVLANARVMLADDDRLAGTISAWKDKKLTIKPAIANSTTIDLPLTSLRQVWCGPADMVKKAQAMKEAPGLEDIAYVAREGDVVSVKGLVIGMEGESLMFRHEGEDRKIALNRIVGLIMAKADEAPADNALYAAIQFANDDQLSGKPAGIEGKDLVIQLRAGPGVRMPVDQIAKLSTRNGRLVYVSDLKPAKVVQTPYFDRVLEYRLDKSLNGKPITLSDGTYQHGISVHSRCVLTYNLDGRFNEFRAKAGFQLPEGKLGQAAIRVVADGKALFENLDARGDQAPADLKLKVDGVRELTLEVDYGKNDDVADRVAWANARLLRSAK